MDKTSSIERNDINILNVISPAFAPVHQHICDGEYTHYWLKGGRGSGKSSFVSIETIWGIMNDSDSNGIVIRKIEKTLRNSVLEQLLWAVEVLGVDELWSFKVTPMELIFIPTGQRILFKGADKPRKIKSTKFKAGYCKFIWYEELEEFRGMEEIRSMNQSLMRGGDVFIVFYTYNPPNSIKNWINTEILNYKPSRIIHHSSYLDVPVEWLGKQFITEAEHLKKVSPEKYEHEYMGEVLGTGGEIFKNVCIRKIEDWEMQQFDRICEGIDWGYAIDPFVWIKAHYDKRRKTVYIFDEIYKTGLSNQKAAELILEKKQGTVAVADCSEPKSIGQMKDLGIKICPAKKGQGSVEFGMKFLTGSLEQIIIDGENCPNTAREFLNYEYERDSNMKFKAYYPDKDNHTIDALRYALEAHMLDIKGGKGAVYVPGIGVR